jgi:hypothetical protein
MIIHDDKTFKTITQLFLFLAILLLFMTAYILKRKKVEITYKVAFKLFVYLVFPIVSFPFIILSTWSLLDKILASLFAISCALLQFYGTMSFHKLKNKFINKDK